MAPYYWGSLAALASRFSPAGFVSSCGSGVGHGCCRPRICRSASRCSRRCCCWHSCCGTEKPAKRGEVESPLRLGQRPNECDALANRASCEAHPVAHVNTRQGLPLDRAWSLMPRDYGCCGTEKPAKRGVPQDALQRRTVAPDVPQDAACSSVGLRRVRCGARQRGCHTCPTSGQQPPDQGIQANDMPPPSPL